MINDFDEKMDFSKLSNAELRLAEKQYETYTPVYLKAVDELCNREAAINKKHDNASKKSEKTQRQIKIMTFVILIFTGVMLYFTAATYQVSTVSNKVNAHVEPESDSPNKQQLTNNK